MSGIMVSIEIFDGELAFILILTLTYLVVGLDDSYGFASGR